jgi:hypothetical protein
MSSIFSVQKKGAMSGHAKCPHCGCPEGWCSCDDGGSWLSILADRRRVTELEAYVTDEVTRNGGVAPVVLFPTASVT